MAKTKTYFRDHYILILLTINFFLSIALIIFIILRLIDIHSSNYIVQCRNCSDPNALNRFINGNIVDLISFSVFGILVFVINFVLSYKTYKLNHNLSIVILYLGILLEIFGLIVSNSLFVLR